LLFRIDPAVYSSGGISLRKKVRVNKNKIMILEGTKNKVQAAKEARQIIKFHEQELISRRIRKKINL